MSTRVLIIHFTPPGVVGGVEGIIKQHAELLADRGFSIEIVAGRRARSRFPFHLIPEIDAARPGSIRIESELEKGVVDPKFYRAKAAITRQLLPLMARSDVVIAHNALTLHFSLPLTAALWERQAEPGAPPLIAWCHDLSWTNPLYISTMYPGYPWDLLRRPAPRTTYVAISQERREELANLWRNGGYEDTPIEVIPNGVDVQSFLRLSPAVWKLAREYRLPERDAVLLLPARITRRKNVEAAVRAVRGLKDRGLDVLLIVSGPRAAHHPVRSRSYLQELKDLRRELNVEREVLFLADEMGRNPTPRFVSELYALADALLFPSSQEGFGVPILEAGLARLPAVVSDIPILREVSGEGAWLFDPEASADTIAGKVLDAIDSAPARLYRRTLREYRWDAIVDRKIVPLLRGEAVARQEEDSVIGGG